MQLNVIVETVFHFTLYSSYNIIFLFIVLPFARIVFVILPVCDTLASAFRLWRPKIRSSMRRSSRGRSDSHLPEYRFYSSDLFIDIVHYHPLSAAMFFSPPSLFPSEFDEWSFLSLLPRSTLAVLYLCRNVFFFSLQLPHQSNHHSQFYNNFAPWTSGPSSNFSITTLHTFSFSLSTSFQHTNFLFPVPVIFVSLLWASSVPFTLSSGSNVTLLLLLDSFWSAHNWM